jgi:hypothetical protein
MTVGHANAAAQPQPALFQLLNQHHCRLIHGRILNRK